jgi:flagellar hook-associated protein 2
MATLNVSSAGSTFFAGTVSGIDTASLIQNATNAKLIPKKRLDDKVSANLKKITAYQTLTTKANALKSAFGKLKTDAVLGNVFDGKQATYSSSSATAASSILTATVGKTAASGTHTVVVSQIAKAFLAQGAAQGSSTDPIGVAGSFTIGEAGKTAATITYDASASMTTIRDAINAQTTNSGVRAEILQTSPGQYRLVITGVDTGTAVTVAPVSGDNILSNLGVTDAGGSFLDVVQPEQQASIIFNGITITNASNTFSNVVTGVTINALSSSPGTTVTISVGDNVTAAREAIKTMVENYNALRKQIDDYKKVGESGKVDPNAALYGEIPNKSLAADLRRLITGTYGAGMYSNLASLGIKLNASNDLEINYTTLDAALANNFDDVAAVFAVGNKFRAASTVQTSVTDPVGVDGSFSIRNDTTGLYTNVAFTAGSTLENIRDSINAAGNGLTAEIINLSTGQYKFVIKGTSDNHTFSFISSTGLNILDTIGVMDEESNLFTPYKGVADEFDTLLDAYTNVTTGTFNTVITSLQSTNTDLGRKADRIKEKTDAYQLTLIDKYAKLEAFIKNATNIKNQIKAILNSGNNN